MWTEGSASFAFDFARYVEGALAVLRGEPAYTVDGYIYTNVLARALAGLGVLVGDDERLTAWHQLFVCAAWPWLAVLVAGGARSRHARYALAALTWTAAAYRGAAELGNIDFEVLLGSLVALRLASARRFLAAGLLIGALAAIKPFAGLFAVPYGVALVRSRFADRDAWRLVVGTAIAFVGLLATDPRVNAAYLSGAASSDIAGRCRGVGLGSVLVGVGVDCGAAVMLSLSIGAAFVVALSWRARSTGQRFGLAGVGQPLVNALTSGYVVGYAIFALVEGVARWERAPDRRNPSLRIAATVFLATGLVLGMNLTGVGIRGSIAGPWLSTIALVVLGGLVIGEQGARHEQEER